MKTSVESINRLRMLPLLLVLILNKAQALSTKLASNGIKFRPGIKTDEIQISLTMAKSLMNPLGIDSKRFVVAVDPTNDKKLYGWAQLRPIGPSIRNPNQFDAAPGSGSLEREIEEEIWEDFENDGAEFPNGFASLPWTKEYKEFAESSSKRRKKRGDLVQMAERQKKDGNNQLWELASVYVLPEWRKKGIGSELIRRIMANYVMLDRNAQDIFLLTLDSTKDWYRGFGFELTDDPPASMALEVAAGGIITNFIGEKLVVMQGGHKTS